MHRIREREVQSMTNNYNPSIYRRPGNCIVLGLAYIVCRFYTTAIKTEISSNNPTGVIERMAAKLAEGSISLMPSNKREILHKIDTLPTAERANPLWNTLRNLVLSVPEWPDITLSDLAGE